TPYTGKGGKGQALPSVTVDFQVVNGSSIAGFLLIDTDSNLPIGPLGPVVDLAATPNVSIQATTEPTEVGSVAFLLNDEARIENFLPYALGGDRRGAYRSVAFTEGPQTLTATPYEKKAGRGSTGASLTAEFEVIYGSVVERLELVNTKTNETIGPLTEGATIDLADPQMLHIGLVAITGPAEVGSVSFEIDGALIKTENQLPYSIAGDRNRGQRLNAFDFSPGNHTLVVRTFSQRGRQGIVGGTLTINYEVTFGAEVDQINIVNTGTGSVISSLDNATIDLQDPVFEQITVIAETTPAVVGSLVFYLDGQPIKTENFKPYAIAGDRNKGQQLFPKNFEVGEFELTVVPYSKPGGQGLMGAPKTITFNVVEGLAGEAASRLASVDPSVEQTTPMEELVVFPVPFSSSLQFALEANTEEELQMQLIDLSGRALITGTYKVVTGSNHLSLDVSRLYLPRGTYLVKIEGKYFGRHVIRVAKD
ncbi:MAG: T9SS type A sorting domain-containing protein, partial [Bacteroidota bacterium]